jgi:hypothetical protein
MVFGPSKAGGPAFAAPHSRGGLAVLLLQGWDILAYFSATIQSDTLFTPSSEGFTLSPIAHFQSSWEGFDLVGKGYPTASKALIINLLTNYINML